MGVFIIIRGTTIIIIIFDSKKVVFMAKVIIIVIIIHHIIRISCFYDWTMLYTEAVVQRCSVKKMFLETSQNVEENTCARVSFLIKFQASGLQLY